MKHEQTRPTRAISRKHTLVVAGSAVLAGAATVALVWLLGSPSGVVAAPNDVWRVCPAGPPACDYATIQGAVDAANPGDVVKVAGGAYTDVHARAGLTQVVYITKSVTIQGGYTVDDWESPDPDAHPTTLDAGGQGRVIAIVGPSGPSIDVTLDGLRLTNGVARGEDDGGGIYARRARLVITGCRVFGNTADDWGGGAYIGECDQALLQANQIFSNTAEYGGGAHFFAADDAQVIENQVYQNRAEHGGGGIVIYSCDAPLVWGNAFHDNRALNSGGGAILLNASDGGIVGQNRLFDNVADKSGGGLEATTRIEGLSVAENAFYDNRSESGYGGGFMLSGVTDAVVRDNRVTGNEAVRGGGIGFGTVSPVTLAGNQIYGNSASSDGGAAYLYSTAPFTMVNNVFASNEAGRYGGGLYLTGSAGRENAGDLVHNTLADNRLGNGGEGVYLESYSTVTLTNNLVAGHEVGLYARPGYTNAVTADYTLFYDNDSDTAGGTVVSTNVLTGADPLFVDPAAWDYHIQSASPAVDAGITLRWPTSDVDGDQRPYGAGYDIGADEFSPVFVYLPLVVRQAP